MSLFKDNKGSTIILITVLVLTSTFTITLTAAQIIMAGLIKGRTQVNSTKAYFAAEAGAERILYEIRNGVIDPYTSPPFPGLGCVSNVYFCYDSTTGNTSGCVNPCPLNNIDSQSLSNSASFRINYKYVVATDLTTLTSYGSYKDVTRAVELKY